VHTSFAAAQWLSRSTVSLVFHALSVVSKRSFAHSMCCCGAATAHCRNLAIT